MATNTLTKLFQVTLTTVDALVYECPALTHATVVALYKVNVDSSDRTFRLHAVTAGGSSGVGNALYYDEPIPTKRLHPRVDTGIVLEPGQQLRGLASANSAVTLTGFGITAVETA